MFVWGFLTELCLYINRTKAKVAILKSSDFEWWFENRTIRNLNFKTFCFWAPTVDKMCHRYQWPKTPAVVDEQFKSAFLLNEVDLEDPGSNPARDKNVVII